MTQRARWTVLVLFLLTMCGGHARGESDTQANAGSASTGSAPIPPMLGASGSAGDTDAIEEAGAAGAEAGAPGYVSLIDSDTRDCMDETYCFGLACYAPDSFAPSVCLAPCETDANCQPFEACLRAPKLEPTCYARCSSPEDCYRGFDCFDFSGSGELVCFPLSWAGVRDKLGY